MKIGVVGLPNVGKSTLFNALSGAGAQSANYPFCTIEPNVGVVAVPDPRVDWLAKHYNAKNVVHATIEFVDIAGLVKGASKGEGLGNKFLANIRESDAIAHVVRCFDGGGIIHVEGNVDPMRDITTINLELILSDLETVEKRIDKTLRQIKTKKTPELEAELTLLEKLKTALESEQMAASALQTPDETHRAREFFLLTTKPVIYCANVDESDIPNDGEANPNVQSVRKFAEKQGNKVVVVCAKIEEELSQVKDEAEKAELLQVYHLKQSGLDKLIASSYELLGLISFLTAGEKEVRAWTIPSGSKAPQAAGKIHSDFERGFIRAETVAYNDFVAVGSLVAAKEAGKLRSEGKEYIVKDGDILNFRFNV